MGRVVHGQAQVAKMTIIIDKIAKTWYAAPTNIKIIGVSQCSKLKIREP
jgi:hypothetical protein